MMVHSKNKFYFFTTGVLLVLPAAEIILSNQKKNVDKDAKDR